MKALRSAGFALIQAALCWFGPSIPAPASIAPLFSSAVNYPTASLEPTGLAVGDLNGDGIPDIVVANNNVGAPGAPGQISILFGNGDGTFQPAVLMNTAGMVAFDVAVADVNNDGKPDLVVSNQAGATGGDGNIEVLLGNGDGTFQAPLTFSAGLNPTRLLLADFNNDGNLDVAVLSSSQKGTEPVYVLLGNGDGTFQTGATYAVGTGPLWVATGDFNGDGNLDLAVANSRSFNVSILIGDGHGQFAAPVNYSTGFNTSSLAVADLNNDGIQDIAVPNSAGLVGLLIGNGDGTFRLGGSVQLKAGFVGAADVNGDGEADLVTTVGNLVPGVSLALATGGGRFAPPVSSTDILSPDLLLVADLNRDGHPDLVTLDEAFNKIGVLLNLGPAPTADNVSTSLTFAQQVVNTTSATEKLALANNGNAPLTITSIALTGANPGDFVESNNCPLSLEFNSSCSILVAFRPQTGGARTASITYADNAPTSPQSTTLSGTGTVFSISPLSLDFGSVQVGSTSQAQTITLSNVGHSSAKLVGVKILNGPAFSQTNNCPATISAGSSCALSVTFAPTESGFQTGMLSISGGGGNPQTVSLSGTGT